MFVLEITRVFLSWKEEYDRVAWVAYRKQAPGQNQNRDEQLGQRTAAQRVYG